MKKIQLVIPNSLLSPAHLAGNLSQRKPEIPLNSESATFGICGHAWPAEAVCDGSVWWTIPDGGMHSVWRTERFGGGRLEDYSERRNGRPPEYLPSLIIFISKWLIIK